MHYIVTGATGFVGLGFVSFLLAHGEEITVLVRNKDKIPTEWLHKVHIIETNMQRLPDLTIHGLKNAQADFFVHFAWAGTSGPERADEQLQLQNVMEVRNAVELAGHLKCKRFIFAGSIMEYDAMCLLTQDGFLPPKGIIYSSAKLLGDFWARVWCNQVRIEYECVIISNIYGPGEKSERFLNTLIRKMMKDDSIDLTSGEQLYDFIYITDAVAGIYLIINSGEAYSSYYLGNSKQYPLKKFILQAKEMLGSQAKLNFGVVPSNGTSFVWNETDMKKIEELGFKPKVSFEEGVIECQKAILKE